MIALTGNRVNLASGQRPFKQPWLNVDIREQGYPVDLIADIRSLPQLSDRSASVMVAHHCLEHIDMSQVTDMAKEWFRILEPGGVVAVFVPDARAIADRWLKGQIDNFTFNVNMYGAYQGHPEDLHRWSYDYQYLIDQMTGKDRQVPWTSVRRLYPQDLQVNPRYEGADCAFDWWILAVEFTK